jgi:hypothetical protein
MAGGPVSWRSVRQTSVSKSTTEAEYIVASETACELIWLNNMLANAGLIKEQAADIKASIDNESHNIYINNKGAIDLANSEGIPRRSKHIEVRYHLLRDLVEKKEIKLTYMSSNENVADSLTKPSSRARPIDFREAIGM